MILLEKKGAEDNSVFFSLANPIAGQAKEPTKPTTQFSYLMCKYLIAVLAFLAGVLPASAQLEFQFVSSEVSVIDNGGEWNQGMYNFRFEVSSFMSEDIVLKLDANRNLGAIDPEGGLTFYVLKGGVRADTSGEDWSLFYVMEHISGGTENGGYLTLQEGESATLEFTVGWVPSTAGVYSVQLEGVNFSSDNTVGFQYMNPPSGYEPNVYLPGTVPEPSVAVLGLFGFAGLVSRRRR